MSCLNHAAVEESLLRCARCGRDFCADCVIVLQGNVLCGECKRDHLRDVVSGVQPGLPLASFRRRVAALLLDRLLMWILTIAVPLVSEWFMEEKLHLDSSMSGKAAWSLFWLTYAGYAGYEGKMLASRGQTLGKILAKIKVVRTDGSPLHAGQAWLRAILRGLFFWALQIINYAPAPVTREKTCIHDLIARTRVVNAE